MKLFKSKGQHILRNKKIAKKIVDFAEVSKNDVVLEVGCGTGVLTEHLLKRSGKVYGIELDTRFIELLKKRFVNEISEERFILIEGDALKIEFPKFTKFVSNIPYSISSPLTFKVLKHKYEKAVIMYQKEFAERLTSNPHQNKKYGRISVIVRALSTPKLLCYVSRDNFYPVPKVDSAIVSFDPNPEIHVKNFEIFKKFVTLSFTMRRKRMSKVFKVWCENCKTRIPESILIKYGDLRAENLTPKDFAEIANQIIF